MKRSLLAAVLVLLLTAFVGSGIVYADGRVIEEYPIDTTWSSECSGELVHVTGITRIGHLSAVGSPTGRYHELFTLSVVGEGMGETSGVRYILHVSNQEQVVLHSTSPEAGHVVFQGSVRLVGVGRTPDQTMYWRYTYTANANGEVVSQFEIDGIRCTGAAN
jgi:hypothetical protein